MSTYNFFLSSKNHLHIFWINSLGSIIIFFYTCMFAYLLRKTGAWKTLKSWALVWELKKTEKGLIEVVTTGLEIIRLPKCIQNIWLLSLNVSIFAMTFVKYFLYLYHVQNISQKGAWRGSTLYCNEYESGTAENLLYPACYDVMQYTVHIHSTVSCFFAAILVCTV